MFNPHTFSLSLSVSQNSIMGLQSLVEGWGCLLFPQFYALPTFLCILTHQHTTIHCYLKYPIIFLKEGNKMETFPSQNALQIFSHCHQASS
jgi:hypothetical protein